MITIYNFETPSEYETDDTEISGGTSQPVITNVSDTEEFEGTGVYTISIVDAENELETSKNASGNKLEFEVPDEETKDITSLITGE